VNYASLGVLRYAAAELAAVEEAGRRVVGAEEDREDACGPAAHHHRPPLEPIGQQVDGQGYEPEEGDLDHMEPQEPSPLLYRVGDADAAVLRYNTPRATVGCVAFYAQTSENATSQPFRGPNLAQIWFEPLL
jgi:hypothetical protein